MYGVHRTQKLRRTEHYVKHDVEVDWHYKTKHISKNYN